MKIRVRGRSFLAFVIAPEPPLVTWLAELDAQIARSPGFFDARPVVLDLAAIAPDTTEGADTLLADLEGRGITIIDVENAGAAPQADPWRRPLVGGRNTGDIDLSRTEKAPVPESPVSASVSASASPEAPLPDDTNPADTSLIVTEPVRSGQSVLFLKGDVTIVGSVASGAEVLGGGSVHIYGTLRGRAIAGALGNANARIFCQKFEAELVSIDGFYKTADSIDPALRGRAVSIWLDGETIVISPLA